MRDAGNRAASSGNATRSRSGCVVGLVVLAAPAGDLDCTDAIAQRHTARQVPALQQPMQQGGAEGVAAPGRVDHLGGRIWVTGSPESDNQYAKSFIAAVGKPSQRLMFVDPNKGRVTSEYVCWLD